MSANMYAWEPSIGLDPKAVDFQKRVGAYSSPASSSPPSAAIRGFVSALLKRYPDLTGDNDTAWADGPLIGDASGGFINISIVWSRYREAAAFFTDTANRHGLHAYDPQLSKFFPATRTTKNASLGFERLGHMALIGGTAISAEAMSRRALFSGILFATL